MPRSEPTESEASQTGRRNKTENGPSPLWGTDGRTANTVSAGGADNLWGNSGLRQMSSLFVGNISKIDGSRNAHFLVSCDLKTKTIGLEGKDKRG